jgi:hypothetical protein
MRKRTIRSTMAAPTPIAIGLIILIFYLLFFVDVVVFVLLVIKV